MRRPLSTTCRWNALPGTSYPCSGCRSLGAIGEHHTAADKVTLERITVEDDGDRDEGLSFQVKHLLVNPRHEVIPRAEEAWRRDLRVGNRETGLPSRAGSHLSRARLRHALRLAIRHLRSSWREDRRLGEREEPIGMLYQADRSVMLMARRYLDGIWAEAVGCQKSACPVSCSDASGSAVGHDGRPCRFVCST